MNFFLFCFVFFLDFDCVKSGLTFGPFENLPENMDEPNTELHQIYNEITEHIFSQMLVDQSDKIIVLHFDSVTSDYINDVMVRNNRGIILSAEYSRKSMVLPVTLMLNYDTIKTLKLHEGYIMRRSTIHIVCLMDALRFDTLYNSHLKPNDIIIFVCHREQGSCKQGFIDGKLISSFLKGSNFHNAVFNTIIIEFSENHLRLYESCFFCGSKANILSLVCEVQLNSETKLENIKLNSEISQLLKKKHVNFNSHIFDIVFNLGSINFICNKPTNISMQNEAMIVSCENSHSLEGNMIKEISKRLNFKYKLLNFEQTHGKARETLISLVNESKADFAIGSISITVSRWQKADFTYPVIQDPCKVLYNVQHSIFKEGWWFFGKVS